MFKNRYAERLYAAGAVVVVGSWLTFGLQYGKINPFEILKAEKQKKEEVRAAIQHQEDRVNRLFGKGGLADTNKDGYISISELEEAYKRMGISIDFIRKRYFTQLTQDASTSTISPIVFPDFTTGDLEKAIKSFEAEAK